MILSPKDGFSLFYNVDEDTCLPTRLYLKPGKDSDDGMTIFFNENGLPDKAVYNDHIMLFGSFRDYQFNMAVIPPVGEVEYYFDMETDIDFNAYYDAESGIWQEQSLAVSRQAQVRGIDIDGEAWYWFRFGLGAVSTGIAIAGCVGAGVCPFLGPILTVGCLVSVSTALAGLAVDLFVDDPALADGLNAVLDMVGCIDPSGWFDCMLAGIDFIHMLAGPVVQIIDDFKPVVETATRVIEQVPVWVPSATPTRLTSGAWKNGIITSSGDEDWYSIYVDAGKTYRIWWNDEKAGDETKIGDILVAARFSDGTYNFNGTGSDYSPVDSGWDTPQTFTAAASGTLYLRVTINGSKTGTYAVAYSTGSTRPGSNDNGGRPAWVTGNPIPLLNGIWADSDLPSSGSVAWYSINVAPYSTIRVWWNKKNVNGTTKTGDVAVGARNANGTFYFGGSGSTFSNTSVSNGWDTPQEFMADAAGTVYLRVVPFNLNAGSTGTFGIVYTSGVSERPAIVEDIGPGGDYDSVFTVFNLDTWDIACNAISNGGNNKSYKITLMAEVEIFGMFANTFGPGSGINVTITGTAGAGLKLGGNGENLLSIGANQSVTIHNVSLTGLFAGRTFYSPLVWVEGTLIMSGNAKVSGNNVGGVVVSGAGSSFTMNDYAQVSGNKIGSDNNNRSAGVTVGGGGTFTMNDYAEVSGNINDYDRGYGGGVSVIANGTFLMNGNAKVTGNTAGMLGGGVYVGDNGIFRMNGGVISGNKGDGVCNLGTFRLVSGIIVGKDNYVYDGKTYTANSLRALQKASGTATYGPATSNPPGSGTELNSTGTPAAYITETIHVENGVKVSSTIDRAFTVSNLTQWNNAVTAISGGSGDYKITLTAEVEIPGTTAYTFGSTTGIDVTITGGGSGGLKLNATNGDLLRIGADQSVTLQNASLKGRGESGNENTGWLVNINGSNATFIMEDSEISGNIRPDSLNSGGGGVTITNGGTFTMNSSTISGNTGGGFGGGGVYVSSGTFTMNGGTITGNTNRGNGGGGVSVSSGTFIMNGNAKVTGNTAGSKGGGVYVSGIGSSFTMNSGTISGNTGGEGGGVYASGTFTMENGASITGNTATYDGGGVYVFSTFTMNGGTISGNTANRDGGGVYLNLVGTFNMKGGTISGNTGGTGGTGTGGGVYVYSNNATFRLVNGTIVGNAQFNGLLPNTAATGGAALYMNKFEQASSTMQRGTFTGPDGAWVSKGDLATSNDTIHVVNGDLVP